MTPRHLSLRNVSVVVMVIAIGISAMLGYVLYRAGEARTETNARVNIEVAQIGRYQTAQLEFSNLAVNLTTYYLLHDPQYIDKFETARAEITKALTDARTNAPELGEGDVARADALLRGYGMVAANEELILRAAERGDTAGALTIVADTNFIAATTELQANLEGSIAAARDDLAVAQRNDRNEQQRSVQISLSIAGVWAVLLVLLGIASFRWLVRPMQRVSSSTLAIAAGDLTARVPENGPRELAQVGADVNTMTSALIQRSVEINAFLARDLEERTSELERANATVIASEARFRTLVQNSSDMVTVIHPDGSTMYVSPSAERILGYRPDEWAALNVLSLVHPDDREEAARTLAVAMAASGEHEAMELRIRHADGSYRNVEMIASNLLNDPAVGGIVHNSRDVTVQRQMEAALRESEARFRGLAEHSPLGIYQLAPDRRVMYLNPAALAIFETDAETAAKTPFERFFTEASLETMRLEYMKRNLGIATSYEVEIVGLKGTRRFLSISGAPVRGPAGDTISSVGTLMDITERKRAEDELRVNEEKYRALVQNSSDVVTVIDAQGVATYASPSIERTLGYAPHDLVGTSLPSLIHPEDRVRGAQSLAKLLATPGLHPRNEFRVRHADGTYRTLEMVGSNLLADPAVQGIVHNSRDVTQQREMEVALRESEARFRGLAEHSPVGIYQLSAQRRVLYLNPAALAILEADDLAAAKNVPFEQYFTAESLETMQAEYATRARGEASTYEVEVIGLKGTRRNLLISGATVADGGPNVHSSVGTMVDITEMKAAQDALRVNEEKYRALAQNASDMVTVVDAEGIATYASPSVERILGYGDAEWLGINVLSIVHPDDQAAAVQSFEKVAATAGEHPPAEIRIRHIDGRYRYVELIASNLLDDPAVRGIVYNSRDVTDRREMEAALRESEGRFRSLVQNASDMVTIVDAEGFVMYASPSVERILGYKEEDWVNVLSLVHPDDLERAVKSSTEVVTNPGSHPSIELRIRRADGEYRYLELIASNLLADPAVRGIVHNARDVTSQHEAESALRESEARFRSLSEHSPVGVYQLSPEQRVLYLNPAALAILEADDLAGAQSVPFEQFFTARGHSYLPWAMRLHMGATVDADETRDVASADEVEAIGLQGTRRNLLVSGAPVLDQNGKINSLVGTMIDISERKRADDELRINEEKFRLLFASNPHPMWVYDRESLEFLEVNDAAIANYGYTKAEFLRMRITDIRPAEDVAAVLAAVNRTSPLMQSGEWRHTIKNGRIIDVEITSHPFRFESRDAVLVVAFDVTERRRVTSALAESEERFRSLVQNASDLITVIRADTTVIYQSPSIKAILGYEASDVMGGKLADLVHPEDAGRLLAFLAEATTKPNAAATFEARLRHADGSWRTFEIVGSDHTADPAVGGFVLNTRDVSERRELEHQLRDQAFKDALTGLANRARFMDRLEHALERSARGANPVAVLFVDLDNFKSVNDSLGHAAGDSVLKQVGQRIQNCLRTGDTVARLGGDEFAALIEDVGANEDAELLAGRLVDELGKPFEVKGGNHVTIGASVGVAFANERDLNRDLVHDADLAMYIAKTHGKSRYEVYNPQMHEAIAKRLELVADLQRALETPELFVEYQPTYRLASGRLSGVEALIRWQHPRRGRIMPAEFIPLAEESGVIVPLGRWVLLTACMQAKQWEQAHAGGDPFSISINVSVRQLQHDTFVEEVAEALRETGVDPATVILEVTESVLMQDVDATIPVLESLKRLGVRLAIDDFGTGYSSLSYLARYPFDILKIDKSFIDGIDAPGQQLELTRAIIELAKVLDLEVVAEGVEREEQAAQLRTLNCDFVQGFLFSRPLPAADVTAMLAGAERGLAA